MIRQKQKMQNISPYRKQITACTVANLGSSWNLVEKMYFLIRKFAYFFLPCIIVLKTVYYFLKAKCIILSTILKKKASFIFYVYNCYIDILNNKEFFNKEFVI